MITWMQRHNRYLVWTIWVATIAFIGAGFVGWGSYKYGSKASAVGKAGDVEITNERLNFTYQNLYERYNEMFKGQFDEEQAKKMGLLKQAFDSLASQAQLLSLAHKYGITVSDKELADYIASMPIFQENGVFNKSIYRTYLQNRRLKSASFEAILADELTIKKLLGLVESPSVPFERTAIASALSVSDKVAYKVIDPAQLNATVSDEEARKAWEANKDQYLTPRRYAVSLLWTDTAPITVTDEEVQSFYDQNSFNYVNADGKQLTLEEAKPAATRDLKIKKGKKQALLDYIALKKGEKQPQEQVKLAQNDSRLPVEMWSAIVQSDVGTLLKPKPIGERYVTVKLDAVIEPEPMPFEQAKAAVIAQLKKSKTETLLEQEAKRVLDNIDNEELVTSPYVSLTQKTSLFPLNETESLQFLQKLFTSSAKKGIITLSSRLVVYKVIDQKMDTSDANLTQQIAGEADQIKRHVFERALFKQLNEQYPVKAYVKGL